MNRLHPWDRFCRVRESTTLAFGPLVRFLLAGMLLWLGGQASVLAADDETKPDDSSSSESSSESVTTPSGTKFEFPLLEEMQIPEAAHFLSTDINTPRDWIVKKDGRVVACLPVSPRPGTVAARRKEIEAKLAERKGLEGDDLERWRDEYGSLQRLEITIPEFEPEPEFRIPLDDIEKIIHHEDQWVERIRLLAQERKIDTALELLNRLKSKRPDWRGIPERTNDLIFADASVRAQNGLPEETLMLLEELKLRTPDYPGANELADSVTDQMIAKAIEANDYRQARYFLNRLRGLYPDSPVYKKHTQQLAQQARRILNQAQAAFEGGQLAKASELADKAARTWRETSGLANIHKSIVERYQRVRVGVLRLPDQPTAYPFPTPADLRKQKLTEIPLFEITEFEDGYARYQTRFFDEWMPYDLGRTTRFELRQTRQPWESQPVLQGWPVTERISARLDPRSEHYDERLATYVQSLVVESPFEFTIHFRRVPPRLEALFFDPIVHADDGSEAKDPARPDASSNDPSPPDLSGGFRLSSQSDRFASYRRVIPEPQGMRQYHVSELVEIAYRDPESALVGLQEGEFDVYPYPPAWIIRRVSQEEEFLKRFFIQKHAVPLSHVIQFHPEQPVLQARELRRALLYAIDRRGILDEVLLREENGPSGRVISGPFPSNSYGNAVGITPRPFDPYAGLALRLAAANSLTQKKVINGKLPTLRMLAPPDPIIRTAAEKIIEGWARIGLSVELIPDSDTTAYEEGRWDLIYRTVQLTDPVVDLWPFLTMQKTARIEDLTILPDWLKQEVVGLDRSSDWTRAVNRVRQLHKHLWLEAAFLPLYEVDQHTIYRKNLRGFSLQPVHPYDGIDRWTREASLSAVGL